MPVLSFTKILLKVSTIKNNIMLTKRVLKQDKRIITCTALLFITFYSKILSTRTCKRLFYWLSWSCCFVLDTGIGRRRVTSLSRDTSLHQGLESKIARNTSSRTCVAARLRKASIPEVAIMAWSGWLDDPWYAYQTVWRFWLGSSFAWQPSWLAWNLMAVCDLEHLLGLFHQSHFWLSCLVS